MIAHSHVLLQVHCSPHFETTPFVFLAPNLHLYQSLLALVQTVGVLQINEVEIREGMTQVPLIKFQSSTSDLQHA